LNPNGEVGFQLPKLTTDDKARLTERHPNERIRVRAAKRLPQILKKHRWTYNEMIHNSPSDVTGDCRDHWRALLAKFAPNDVVWIGSVRDSGGPEMP